MVRVLRKNIVNHIFSLQKGWRKGGMARPPPPVCTHLTRAKIRRQIVQTQTNWYIETFQDAQSWPIGFRDKLKLEILRHARANFCCRSLVRAYFEF